MNQNKALNLLSLARKGRRIEVGEEPVGAAARAGHARLIVIASDATDHAFRRVKSFTAGTNQLYLKIPFTKDELGAALGRTSCAMAALTDVALAQAFVKALDQPQQHAQLLEALDTRVQRVRQRQAEEKAHRYNKKHGKK